MARYKIEPTGCSERNGLVQVRYCLYLDPGDYGYEKHHVRVPVIPAGGYPREAERLAAENAWFAVVATFPRGPDKMPILPKDFKTLPVFMAYEQEMARANNWLISLPFTEQDNPFHNHFVQFEPGVTDEEICFVGELALRMAREFWDRDEFPNIKNQPVTFSAHPAKRALAADRVAQIKMTDFEAIRKGFK